jgi:hypothetical protein
MFFSLDKLKPNTYIKLKTKTQNNIVIFGIFHKKLYCYFAFFLNNFTKIRLLFIKTQHFSVWFFSISTIQRIEQKINIFPIFRLLQFKILLDSNLNFLESSTGNKNSRLEATLPEWRKTFQFCLERNLPDTAI